MIILSEGIVQFYSTLSSKLDDLPVKKGQLIFCYDTQVLYLDNNGLRLPYNVIKVFRNDELRKGLINPAEGFYFVERECVLWRYKNGWKQLTPNNLEPIVMGDSVADFPSIGNDTTLYVTGDATYRYNVATKEYLICSNLTDWKELGK